MTTVTDTELRLRGVEVLINALGEVQAERFIGLIMREPFDYTEWQQKLWADKSIEEISEQAMAYRKQQETSS